ncbi:transmembrane protein 272-like [Babylonia areolata]|uniref:transmembrane protein 272-like n=1 Tax=Babylonia areolata TaxID=304850 RepID=UPI003FD5B132
MSMLTRKGTLVRKHRQPLRKQSVRRTRSGGSTSSAAQRTTEEEESSVPPSPITKLDPRLASNVEWAQSQSVSVDTGDTGQQDTLLQLEELAKDTDSTCEFMGRVGKVLCSSDVMTVLLAASMIIPVAMVSLGVKFLDQCPLEPRVPVYLLVGGCVLMLRLILCLWRAFQRRRHDSADATYDENDADAGFSSRTYRFMNAVLTLFLLGWHVAGSYWLFSIWKPRFSPLLHSPSQWCERSVYLFSVGVNVTLYLVVSVYLLLLCCLGLIYRPPDPDLIH